MTGENNGLHTWGLCHYLLEKSREGVFKDRGCPSCSWKPMPCCLLNPGPECRTAAACCSRSRSLGLVLYFPDLTT